MYKESLRLDSFSRKRKRGDGRSSRIFRKIREKSEVNDIANCQLRAVFYCERRLDNLGFTISDLAARSNASRYRPGSRARGALRNRAGRGTRENGGFAHGD